MEKIGNRVIDNRVIEPGGQLLDYQLPDYQSLAFCVVSPDVYEAGIS
jgi:hypothetical protein